jgi:hypothetical protein
MTVEILQRYYSYYSDNMGVTTLFPHTDAMVVTVHIDR